MPDAAVATWGFVLEGGGEGNVTAYAALRTIVHSPRAFPPGATLRASIPGIACPLEVKVRTCKRISTDPLVFSVDGRLQNGTREMLDHLGRLPPP
jgi:hypothetical protein